MDTSTNLSPDILIMSIILFRTKTFVPSPKFLAVIIVPKDRKSVSSLKLEPFTLTDSTNVFHLLNRFVANVLLCMDGRNNSYLALLCLAFTHPHYIWHTHLVCWSAIFWASDEPPSHLHLFSFFYSDWPFVVTWPFSHTHTHTHTHTYIYTVFFDPPMFFSLWRRAFARNVR